MKIQHKMNYYFNKTYLFVVLIVLTVCSDVSAEVPKFSLSLVSNKSEYVLGEPATVNVVVTYNGEADLSVNNPLDNGDYKERIEIAAGTLGEFKRFYSWSEASDAKIDRAKTLPCLHWNYGRTTTNQFILFCWWLNRGETNPLVFSKAGIYRIRYTVEFAGDTFTNIIPITFIEPKSGADDKTWRWLQKQDKIILQEFGGLDRLSDDSDIRAKTLSHFSELIIQSPESVHTKFMKC
jgi:hypothetical protein